jgi:aminoglycoside phosphotransferase (APT) family kinase protein
MSYNLSKLENDSTIFKKLIYQYFDCDVIDYKKVGEGFYGQVYLIDIQKSPNKVIVKWYKHKGNNTRESEQLGLLKKYSLLKVPDVYYIHNYSEYIPYEAVLMEYIEGVNASHLPTNHENKEKFVEEMVDNLIYLHSVTNESGYGEGNVLFNDWKTCLRNKIDDIYRNLKSNNLASSKVMGYVDVSLQAFDDIFSEPVVRSSLIHSDYNLWNILVDKKTAKITAIIDPLDAGWADKEMDLFHLENADGNRFGLLEYYINNAGVSELFPVKNAFYWFWDDMKHLVNVGWYDEKRFLAFGDRMISLMDKHL